MFRPKTLAILALVLTLALTAGAQRASADFIFQLTTANSSSSPPLSNYPGPYVQVDVHWTDPTHARITFTSMLNNGNIYLMGDGGTVGVNVNATSWSIGGFLAQNGGTGFTPGPLSNGGAGNEDGFGSFNQTVNSAHGFQDTSDTVSFVLTNLSGTWANANAVLTANASGHLAAAHIFVANSPAVAGAGALTTGFATDDGPAVVPVPSSALLLGLGGLIALGCLRCRRDKVVAAV